MGGVSPSQFARTRPHAAGESETSPAVATRISVASCWKGPPSPGPPAAAADAASHASRGGTPGRGASAATTTSRSALSIARRTGHDHLARLVSDSGFEDAAGTRFSGVDAAESLAPPGGGSARSGGDPTATVAPSRRSQGASRLASASSRALSSAAAQDVPTRMVATRPKPTAALTAMVTGSGDVASSAASSASYRSWSSSLPVSSGSTSGGSASPGEPGARAPEDLYRANETPAFSNPEAFAPAVASAVPEPSSEYRRGTREAAERRAPDANDIERSWSAARSPSRASEDDPSSNPHSARQKRAIGPVCFPASPGEEDAPTAPSSTPRALPPTAYARRRRA